MACSCLLVNCPEGMWVQSLKRYWNQLALASSRSGPVGIRCATRRWARTNTGSDAVDQLLTSRRRKGL
jgi:hypothetical protein